MTPAGRPAYGVGDGGLPAGAVCAARGGVRRASDQAPAAGLRPPPTASRWGLMPRRWRSPPGMWGRRYLGARLRCGAARLGAAGSEAPLCGREAGEGWFTIRSDG
jgi:hypothetical protein